MTAFRMPSTRPSIALILYVVADEFAVTVLDLKSDRRAQPIARARQVAMYLARHTTTYSLPQIGYLIGNRDHTTVMHGVERITSLLGQDNDLATRVNLILDALARVRVEAVPNTDHARLLDRLGLPAAPVMP